MAEYKNLFGCIMLPVAIIGGTLLATFSRRVRDLFFFLLVVLLPMTQRMDVNFVSREWYRGTTRGFEFSSLDFLSISILFSLLIRPCRGQSRWYWPRSLGFMLLFFLYGCFSVAISDPQLFGLFELSKMLRGIVVFLAAALFVRDEREVAPAGGGLALCGCWQGALGLYQRYHDGTYRVWASSVIPTAFPCICAWYRRYSLRRSPPIFQNGSNAFAPPPCSWAALG